MLKDQIVKEYIRWGKTVLCREEVIRAAQIDRAVARYCKPQVKVIINGFFRSGTTWVQESIAAASNSKTVFEPFSSACGHALKLLQDAGINEIPLAHSSILGPRFLERQDIVQHLDASFNSSTWSSFQRHCRRSVLESMRRKLVVKGVRFHFILSALSARYGAPIVHVRRHPCGVIASLLNVQWVWSFDEVKLTKLFAISLDGCDVEVLDRAAIAVRKFDNDAVSRIAAYWAIVEWSAQRQLAQTGLGKIVWYEDLLNDPQQSISNLCWYCGLAVKRSFNHESNSVVTSKTSYSIPAKQRGERWRNQLKDVDTKRVMHIVNEIAPEIVIQSRKHLS